MKKIFVFISLAFQLFPPNSVRAASYTPKDFGAKGDTVKLVDGAISSGSTVFTSASASFTSADVGKAIVVSGAGTGGSALVTTISSFTSATAVGLTASASSTVSGALAYFGSDDTSAIRSCIYGGTMAGGRCTLNDGLIFMVSSTSSTINFFGAPALLPGGLLDGTGTIVFAPQGTLTGGTNDRLFYLPSQEFTNPLQIAAGSIVKGSTAFTAQNASDASQLSAGDWVIVTERDSGAADNVYVDWIQVASVSGTTVNTLTPFRMAFPNARTWSGSPNYWGLSFRKVSPILQNVTIRGINIVIPQVTDGTNRAVGIITRDTRSVTVTNVNCNDASQNCFAGYMDQGLIFTGNHLNDARAPEFASQVDAVISSNHFNELGSSLFGFVAPQGQGALLDFGSGFNTFANNTIGPTLNSGLDTFYALHDSSIVGNTFGWVHGNTGGACLHTSGGYRNIISANVCSGGDQSTYGISIADTTALNVNINSDSNVVWNNQAYASGTGGNYVCSPSLGTDNCFDPTQGNLTLKHGLIVGGGSTISKVLMGYGTLTYTAISAQSCQEKTLTLTGSATTGTAAVSPSASLGNTKLSWSGWVSSTNAVTVRVCNVSSSSITPSTVTWNAVVFQ